MSWLDRLINRRKTNADVDSGHVFISYAREDGDFVRKLHGALSSREIAVWVDWQRIPPAEDFMKAICSAIEAADSCVFVLSPASLLSSPCRVELDHAVHHRKRLIPVLLQEVSADDVAGALRILNWITFTDPHRFEDSLTALIDSVDTDLDWVRCHTSLLRRCIEWDATGRDDGSLLRGAALSAAESALQAWAGVLPEPTALQREFVRQSKRQSAAEARLRGGVAHARIKGEMEAAKRVQLSSMPNPSQILNEYAGVQLVAHIDQASEVGGDFYNAVRLDSTRFALVVGDVAGKGVPAGLFASAVNALFAAIAGRCDGELGTRIRQWNLDSSRHNAESLFVSFVACVLDTSNGALEYCIGSAGSPYIVDKERRINELSREHAGPPLCVLDDFAYETHRVDLRGDDTLCIFTDGITDAHNERGEPYGIERLKEVLAAADVREPVQELADRLCQDLRAFCGGSLPSDDATFLLLRWKGGAAAQ